jgi:hypothetical protein
MIKKSFSLYDRIINSQEKTSKYVKDTVFRGFYVNNTYLDFFKENEEQISDYMRGTFKRLRDENELSKKQNLPINMVFDLFSLDSHISFSHKYVNCGSEGVVFQLPFKDKNLVMKFYCLDNEESGLEQFEALINPPKGTIFKTPQPYMASPCVCIMEDFSNYLSYMSFLDKYPKEEKKLYDHILLLVNKDPFFTSNQYVTDIGDITTEYDTLHHSKEKGTLPKDGGSIFITNFNKNQEDPYKRYTLGLVDVKISN